MVDYDNEKRMRELLSEHADRTLASAPSLNADAVISRARRRRLPKQFAVGGASALAVVGLLTIAVPTLAGSGLFGDQAGMEAASTLTDMADSPEREYEAPAQGDDVRTTGCELPPAVPHQIADMGVELRAVATNDVGVRQFEAEIVLANEGETEIAAALSYARFLLTQNDATVAAFDWLPEQNFRTLSPGATVGHSLTFTLDPCVPGTELTGSFELTVLVEISGELATSNSVIVSVP